MSNNEKVDISGPVDGKPLRQILHENRLFIQANKGAEYEVKVKNNTDQRVLASFSIDGTDPLSGEKSGKDAGYVINAHDSFILKGFRVSDEKVVAFRFNDMEKSYAVKNPETKSSENVGCIGVRVFFEKEVFDANDLFRKWSEMEKNRPKPSPRTPWHDDYWPDTYPIYPTRPWYPTYPNYPIVTWGSHTTTKAEIVDGKLWGQELRCMNNSMNSSLGGNVDSLNGMVNCSFSVESPTQSHFNAGTEFSDKEIIDRVKEVSFEKGTLIQEVEIFYAWKEDLLRMGVPIIKETKVNFPEAFPKKYCVKPE